MGIYLKWYFVLLCPQSIYYHENTTLIQFVIFDELENMSAPITIHFLFLWTGNKITNLSFTSQILFTLMPQRELSACLFQLLLREEERNIWPIKNNGRIHFDTGLVGTLCFRLQLTCQVHSALWLPSISVFTTNQANSGRQLNPLTQSSFYGHACLTSTSLFHACVINRSINYSTTQTSSNTDFGAESSGDWLGVSEAWVCVLADILGSCVTFGNLFNLSEPVSLCTNKGNNTSWECWYKESNTQHLLNQH